MAFSHPMAARSGLCERPARARILDAGSCSVRAAGRGLWIALGLLLAVPAVLPAGAQDGGKSPESQPAPDDDPLPRYAGFSDMAGQIAEQVARIDGRLPGGPIPGLTGQDGFIGAHVDMLARSRAALEDGLPVAGDRLAAHERAVLAFLDRATQISRLLSDLEKAETEANQRQSAALREEIAGLASGSLFAVLTIDEPARLVVVVEQQQDGSVYWPHTIHRVHLRVENRGAEDAGEVELDLEPVNSVIAEAGAGDSECAPVPADPAWRCAIERISAGEQWRIAVAFRHVSPDTVEAGPAIPVRVEVRAESRRPRLEVEPAELAFSVANCSANYHVALGELGADRADLLLDAMKAATRGEPDLPRRWVSRRPRGGDASTRDLFARANRIVARRGAEPWLAAAADGEAVSRVVYGLRRYLRQDYYAALCTGGPTVADTYRRFLADFADRRKKLGEDSSTARGLAADAVRRLGEALGHEAVGGDGTGDGAGPASPASLAADLAGLAGVPQPDAGDGGAPEGQPGPSSDWHSVFATLRTLAGSGLRQKLSGEELDIAGEALALIEAAFYFDLAERRYRDLERAFNDVLGGIANAHAAQCGCRTSDYSIAPAVAPVPVQGIEPPPPAPRDGPTQVAPPRPKPRPVAPGP